MCYPCNENRLTNATHPPQYGNMGQSETALRRLVEQRHGTVTAFCRAAGLGRTTAYRLFKGELATFDTADKAAAALGIATYELVDMITEIQVEEP